MPARQILAGKTVHDIEIDLGKAGGPCMMHRRDGVARHPGRPMEASSESRIDSAPKLIRVTPEAASSTRSCLDTVAGAPRPSLHSGATVRTGSNIGEDAGERGCAAPWEFRRRID